MKNDRLFTANTISQNTITVRACLSDLSSVFVRIWRKNGGGGRHLQRTDTKVKNDLPEGLSCLECAGFSR